MGDEAQVARDVRPAETLRLGCRRDGEAAVEWVYDVDGGRFTGALRVTYPFALDEADARLLAPIGVGVAVFLGQLCLARRIELAFPASAAMVAGMRPLAEMLYDVRRWKDGADLLPPPTIQLAAEAGETADAAYRGEPRRSCLLWSGGKDSTLSALLLRKNGYDVRALHIPANAGMEAAERDAAVGLAGELELAYQTLGFEFPGYLPLSDAYAVNWNQYPLCNTVPFGRDLALALLAAPVARHAGASVLSVGHEHDCKTAYFTYQGKIIPRNDVESTRGALALERYLRRFMLPELRLLPPLAPLPEYRVLYEMLVHHPAIAARISFCFWGDTCGRCSKCFRYHLAERVLGREGTFHFQVNPLEGDNCPELAEFVQNWRDESTLFQQQVLYGLGRLVERDDIRPGEHWLERFRDDVYPHVAARLNAIEVELMTIYSDPQVPADFIVP